MKNIFKSLIATLTIAGAAFISAPVQASGWVKVGTLTCQFEPTVGLLVGSHRNAGCIYSDINGHDVVYSAEITRVGIDIGFTKGQTLVWAVVAPGRKSFNSLEGTYMGASAEATLIAGVNANALLGGIKNSIALQPISVGMQSGASFALAATSLRLYDAQ